jgi:hypothetical protein
MRISRLMPTGGVRESVTGEKSTDAQKNVPYVHEGEPVTGRNGSRR